MKNKFIIEYKYGSKDRKNFNSYSRIKVVEGNELDLEEIKSTIESENTDINFYGIVDVKFQTIVNGVSVILDVKYNKY